MSLCTSAGSDLTSARVVRKVISITLPLSMRLVGEISIFHAGHQKYLMFACQDRERGCQAVFLTGNI